MNSVFFSKQFEIRGTSVPEFELKRGNLVRIYVPNFNEKNEPLGLDLTLELIKRFQNQKANFPWAKNNSQSEILELLRPLTVKRYLIKDKKIDENKAKRIVEEIGVSLTDKFEYLSFLNKKALIIKAFFEMNDAIILDYYGVSANGINFLERIVNSEIDKGKSAIAFDLLQYVEEQEPFKNIKRVKITLSTKNTFT